MRFFNLFRISSDPRSELNDIKEQLKMDMTALEAALVAHQADLATFLTQLSTALDKITLALNKAPQTTPAVDGTLSSIQSADAQIKTVVTNLSNLVP
jgi:hypothetical protein